ncbi:HupE/UreJ family protein [Salinarimonas ramus]|uniref:Urease accessory protein UreJ n=1 Tax=Salinarimonas ramus TaxID=690164 RepID=A0A917Q492_9HYPH|nr:HupE/UreJ family protein [Salinarimonas ramus]GGK19402.1 urease accessory protein UreJ [Salinarimonas ramus]
MMKFSALGAAALLVMAASPALAHVGHHPTDGFAAGLTHPLTGLDHLLAIVAVGLWAGLVGGRALWAWPAAFVAAMTAAALYGMVGPWLPGVELAIAGSVLALGLAVALRLSAPVVLGAVTCGAFALAHGYAHGAELPLGAGAGAYVAGFVLATAGLHGLGLALGRLLARDVPHWATRGAGAAVAATGLVLMMG